MKSCKTCSYFNIKLNKCNKYIGSMVLTINKKPCNDYNYCIRRKVIKKNV